MTFIVGIDRSSYRSTQGATNNCTITSTDLISNGRSCTSTDGATDCRVQG